MSGIKGGSWIVCVSDAMLLEGHRSAREVRIGEPAGRDREQKPVGTLGGVFESLMSNQC